MLSIQTRLLAIVVVVTLIVAPGSAGASQQDRSQDSEPITRERGAVLYEVRGVLSVVRGDPRPGFPGGPVERYVLSSDRGVAIEFAIAEGLLVAAGGARFLDGRRVKVLLETFARPETKVNPALSATVRALQVEDREVTMKGAKSVSGPQPWISILCKFSDVSVEPRNLSFFRGMYSSSYPGLDYYWRELSYNKANVSGSSAVAWVTMPQPQSHYYSSDGGDIDAMLNDCTAAADPYVYFPNYVGINMMFNAEFGPYAWGGNAWVSRDGVSRIYRVTWEPPWGFSNMGVIAHEMGHGFGLPHSNNADGDASPYDNPWDVMSDTWYYVIVDSTYGRLGKGTIAYHRDILGWIDAERRLDINTPGIYHATLDNLSLATTSNLRLVNVHIPGSSRYYTVEVRDREGFDASLPDFAVIIHEVLTSRKEDAWLIDPDNPTDGADEGAMWRVGECFDDQPNQISVCVQSVTTEGFVVRVEYGDTSAVFDDGFESSNTNAWSSTVP